jgi:metal-responsive CopG/Arc/MetJ family transcriptional regulator
MEIKLNPEMRVVTVKVEEDLLQKLELYAMKLGVTRSEVIREALRRYDWGNKTKVPRIHVITVKLDEDLFQKLDLYAMNSRVTKSEVIREALKRYLSKGGEQ